MPEVTHAQLETFLVHCYRNKVPLFVHGTMGIGKSMQVEATAKAIAKSVGKTFINWNDLLKPKKLEILADADGYFIFADIRLSQADPSDIKGIPRMLDSGDFSDWAPPLLFATLGQENADGMIFFDELNLAMRSIQNSAYQIIHDKKAGEYPLNPKIGIIAAGNRIDDGASVVDMSAPLRNRFTHVVLLQPSAENWINWAIPAGVDRRIIGYLTSQPQDLFTYSKDRIDQSFATPRTWEVASKLIHDIQGTENTVSTTTDRGEERSNPALDQIEMLVGSAIGEGIAAKLRAFLEIRNIYKPQDFLDNPEKAKELANESPDVKWSIIMALGDIYATLPSSASVAKQKAILDKCFQIANHLPNEFGILMLRTIRGTSENDARKWRRYASDCPAFAEFATKNEDIIIGSRG